MGILDSQKHPSLNAIQRDIIWIVLLNSVLFGLFIQIDLFERIYEYSIENENSELDELIPLLFTIACSLSLFSYRRFKELKRSHEINQKSKDKSVKTSEILSMIASGKDASLIYDSIAKMYEAMHPGMRCSMLILKGNTLLHAGAPSLPKAYCDAVNGLENGPNIGSCGTSTYTGKRVLVEDIATDPKWANIKQFALPHGLRSCWSEPIVDPEGGVLGAFGMYYNYPALPNEKQLSDLDSAAKLTAIIMQREKREELLRLHSSSLEQSGEGIIITDREGVIEYANPAYSQITGYSQEEVIGKNPSISNSGEQDLSFYKRLWNTILKGNNWSSRITDRHKDGHLYPAILSIAPIRDKSGVITHFVGVHKDITNIVSLEEQLYQAQKMEAIGTLVGGIAHDFNNILAGITGNIYLARSLSNNSAATEKLENIEGLSFRAANLIKQLLTFAKKGHVSLQPIALAPYIKESIKLLRSSVPENIEIKQNICSDDLYIKGDTTLIYQIVMNIISNAVHAVEAETTPHIYIKLEKFHPDEEFLNAHATHTLRESYAHLSVEDNGTGIAKEQLSNIFEPFYTTKEQGKGTGLGLAMVYGAIQTHDGIIDVESLEGSGSTLHIYLPSIDLPSCPPPPQWSTRSKTSKGETILLVEDDPSVIQVGQCILESLGYQVLTASDGLKAIDIFSENSEEIDLIITDIVMPKLGGIEAVKRIRESSPDIKVIFSTGYHQEHMTRNEPDLKSERILSKPYTTESLIEAITEELSTPNKVDGIKPRSVV